MLLSSWEKSNIVKVKEDIKYRQHEHDSNALSLRIPGTVSEQVEDSISTAETMESHRDDLDSDTSSEGDESDQSQQQDSISTIVLENARLIIDRLYKLSFRIRSPATRFGFSKAGEYCEIDAETGVDVMKGYAFFDLRHVTEIVGQYQRRPKEEYEDHYLVRRLAEGNTHRRRQFGQWGRQKLKLESADKMFLQTIENQVNIQAAPVLNIPRDSANGAFSSLSNATRLDENFINLNDATSTISSSTYAVSSTKFHEIDITIPSLPEKLYTGKDFECPYCHVLCSRGLAKRKARE